jgi:hypothetical protein
MNSGFVGTDVVDTCLRQPDTAVRASNAIYYSFPWPT